MARVSGKRRTRDVIAKPAVPGVPEVYNPSEVDRAIDAVASATERVIDKLEPHLGAGGTVHPVATTTAAGFAPALDGSSGHYLNGLGAWARPGGSMLVTSTAGKFDSAILGGGATTLLIVDVGGFVTTVAVKTTVGWIVWTISDNYDRATFDATYGAYTVYEVTGIEA